MNLTSTAITIVTILFLALGITFFYTNQTPAPAPADTVMCPMDAMECPDGSYVGRTGPDCEFAACPSTPVVTPDEPVTSDDDMVMCTMDVRECSDGSYVGRVAPSCAFAACPDGAAPLDPVVVDVATMCTPPMRAAEACIEIYAPVCATMRVECVSAPCEPVQQTFSNGCFACIEDRVLSFTEGACAGDEVSM